MYVSMIVPWDKFVKFIDKTNSPNKVYFVSSIIFRKKLLTFWKPSYTVIIFPVSASKFTGTIPTFVIQLNILKFNLRQCFVNILMTLTQETWQVWNPKQIILCSFLCRFLNCSYKLSLVQRLIKVIKEQIQRIEKKEPEDADEENSKTKCGVHLEPIQNVPVWDEFYINHFTLSLFSLQWVSDYLKYLLQFMATRIGNLKNYLKFLKNLWYFKNSETVVGKLETRRKMYFPYFCFWKLEFGQPNTDKASQSMNDRLNILQITVHYFIPTIKPPMQINGLSSL